MAQTVNRLPTVWETRVRSLGREDSPGEGNSNPLQYSCLENPMDQGAWGLQSMGSQSQTRLSDFTSLQSEILTDLIHMHRSSLGSSITLLLFRCYLCPALFDPLDCSGVTHWTAGSRQDSLSSTISQSLLRLMSVESVMPSNHLILCRPLLLPSIFPSIRVFSNESALHTRWLQYWSLSFSISPSSTEERESELIS